MDVGAALEALGLTSDVELTRDRVRRAYMRRLREHPPERDPDGFQRLREAYELVMQMVSATPLGLFVEARAIETAPVETLPTEAAPRPPASEPTRTLEDHVAEVLDLLERGDVDAALRLSRRSTDQLVDDHRAADDQTVARWALTRELLVAAAPQARYVTVPDHVTRALAHGLAIDDMSEARAAIEDLSANAPWKAQRLELHLAKRAPSLYTRVATGFRGSVRPATGTRGTPWWIGVFVVFALFGALRLIAGDESNRSRARDRPIVISPQVQGRLFIETDIRRVANDPALSSAQREAAATIERDVRERRCSELPGDLAQLDAASGADLARELARLRADADAMCGRPP